MDYAAMSTKDIAEEHGVSIRRAQEIRRRELLKLGQVEPTIREAVIAVLDKFGPIKTVESLAGLVNARSAIKYTPPQVARMVTDLGKESQVKFTAMADGPRHIDLTNLGRELHRPIQTRTPHASAHRGASPIGKDMTDPRNHLSTAIGGPVERAKVAATGEPSTALVLDPSLPPWWEYKPNAGKHRITQRQASLVPRFFTEHGLTEFSSVEARDRLGFVRSTGRWSLVSRAAEAFGWVSIDRKRKTISLTPVGRELFGHVAEATEEAPVKAAVQAVETPPADAEVEIDVSTYTPPQATLALPEAAPVDPLADYPLIRGLMDAEVRRSRFERAAAILMEDEDDDAENIALSLLERVSLSESEKEVIRFVKNCMA